MPPRYIPIDHLRVGVFVRLEMNWLEHPFFLSSFKIKNMEQIRTLRGLGISEILYVPEKSDCRPAPPSASGTAEDTLPAQGDEQRRRSAVSSEEAWKVKEERIKKLQERRRQITRCQQNYQKTYKKVKAVLEDISTGSGEAAEQADHLVKDIVGTLLADKDAIVQLMNMESKDEAIYYHNLNVTILALVLAKQYGLDSDQARLLGLGALFHDIGKLRIPKQLLYKRGPLSGPERKLLQLHPKYGYDMMSRIGWFERQALDVIRHHHETNDGQGYPDGLSGSSISVLAKITAIANEYDNLCNRLNPEESLTPSEALAFMYRHKQKQLDRKLLSLFISCLGVYPPGSIVQLTNGLTGMVISINPGKPLQPNVLVYDPGVPKKEALIIGLEELPELKIERSLRPAAVPPEVYAYLDPRTRVNYFFQFSSDKKDIPPLQ